MRQTYHLRNQDPFTLIELLSVLIIVGFMGSVDIKKVDFMTDTASAKALAIAVKELNVKESLVWSKIIISDDRHTTDADLFSALDKDLVRLQVNGSKTLLI